MTNLTHKTPLKILLITNHRRFKINFRAYPWARELAARGHDVDVMCHADTERWKTKEERVEGFRIIENPDLLIGTLRQGWDPVCALRRRNFLFREAKKYDIIHCLDTRPTVILPALSYAKRYNTVIVSDWIDWWGRGGLITERRPWWYRQLFGWFEVFFEEHYRAKLHGLTAISRALVERAIALGVPRQDCIVIHGGANLKNFNPLPSQTDCKKALNLPTNSKVICFSGLDVLIDLPLALEAFEMLHRKNQNTLLFLVGPTTKDIPDSFKYLINSGKIHTTGPVPYTELKNHLPAADLFVMPYTNKVSNVGRWPNKIGDYMCVGRPTISNPIGEVKWLFEKYNIGVLADSSAEAMAAKMELLLSNKSTAKEKGNTARSVAEQTFCWPNLVGTLEDWYFKIIAKQCKTVTSES